MKKILARIASFVLLMVPTLVEYRLYENFQFSIISALIIGWFTYLFCASAEKAGRYTCSRSFLPEMSGILLLSCAFVCLFGDDLALFFGFVIPLLIIGVTYIFCFQLSLRAWKVGE